MKIQCTIKKNSVLLQAFLESKVQISCKDEEERKIIMEYLNRRFGLLTENCAPTFDVKYNIGYNSLFRNTDIHDIEGDVCVLNPTKKDGYWSEFGHLPIINAKDIDLEE